jgi:hypothetical protein
MMVDYFYVFCEQEDVDRDGLPSLVQLCKDGVWHAVRNRVRRGRVTKDEMVQTLDGKTAAEWAAKNDNPKVAGELQLALASA